MVKFSLFGHTFGKSQEEKEHEKMLAELKRQKELQAAKLEASEVSDDVITARKRMRTIQELTEGVFDPEQQERLLRTLGRDLGIQELSVELSAEKQMEVLKELTDDDFKKMEKMLKAQKEKTMIGFDGSSKKKGYRK